MIVLFYYFRGMNSGIERNIDELNGEVTLLENLLSEGSAYGGKAGLFLKNFFL